MTADLHRKPANWRPYRLEESRDLGRPRPDLLAAAAGRLATLEGVEAGSVRWRAGAPVVRPHSTLIPLVAELAPGREIGAWQKVTYIPHIDGQPDLGWADQEKEGIERCRQAEEEVRRRFGDSGGPLRLPAVWASDPETLTVVLSTVEGKPFGKVLALRPSYWMSQRRRFVRLGRAVELLESLIPPPMPSIEETRAERRLAGALDLARRAGLPGSFIKPIEYRLCNLWDALLASEAPTAYVHGDLSGSNVLWGKDGCVGLIDLGWKPRLRGFDLATYTVRLDLERPRLGCLTRRALADLEEGNGVGSYRAPGFLLERSQRLLRLLGEGAIVWSRRRPGAVLRELLDVENLYEARPQDC